MAQTCGLRSESACQWHVSTDTADLVDMSTSLNLANDVSATTRQTEAPRLLLDRQARNQSLGSRRLFQFSQMSSICLQLWEWGWSWQRSVAWRHELRSIRRLDRRILVPRIPTGVMLFKRSERLRRIELMPRWREAKVLALPSVQTRDELAPMWVPTHVRETADALPRVVGPAIDPRQGVTLPEISLEHTRTVPEHRVLVRSESV